MKNAFDLKTLPFFEIPQYLMNKIFFGFCLEFKKGTTTFGNFIYLSKLMAFNKLSL